MDESKTNTKETIVKALKNTTAYLARHPSTILVCISASLYILLCVTAGASGRPVEYSTLCIMMLLISLTWFVMGEHRRILEKMSDLEKKDGEITCHCEEFSSNLSEIKDGLGSLKEIDNTLQTVESKMLMLAGKEVASVALIKDPNEFYKKLKAVESSAMKRIWLTHLDPFPPTSRRLDTSTTNERKIYFDFLNDFAKENKTVEIRRIIGISTMEKLEWLDEQMRLTEGIDNISFAYIRADYFGEDDALSPLTIISCQIIDGDKTFVLNPNYNHVPQMGDWNDCPPMYFESKEVSEVYRTYYERLWQRLKMNDCEIGCILKAGPVTEGYKKYRETIRKNILQSSSKLNVKKGPEIINLEGLVPSRQ